MKVSPRGRGETEREGERETERERDREIVLQRSVDCILNVETEFHAWLLADLAAQSNVKYHRSPVTRRGLIDVRHEVCVLTSPDKNISGRDRLQASSNTRWCFAHPIPVIVSHDFLKIDSKINGAFQNRNLNFGFLFDLIYITSPSSSSSIP